MRQNNIDIQLRSDDMISLYYLILKLVDNQNV